MKETQIQKEGLSERLSFRGRCLREWIYPRKISRGCWFLKWTLTAPGEQIPDGHTNQGFPYERRPNMGWTCGNSFHRATIMVTVKEADRLLAHSVISFYFGEYSSF